MIKKIKIRIIDVLEYERILIHLFLYKEKPNNK